MWGRETPERKDVKKMKFLTDRKEIANEINIKETPVVVINIRSCMAGYDRCYEGDKVVVDDIRCTVKMYGDGKNEGIENPAKYEEIVLMPENVMLKASFGYSDVKEMAEWRKATRLTEGGDVIVIFDAGNGGFVRKMKVGKVAKWVYPTAKFEDVE